MKHDDDDDDDDGLLLELPWYGVWGMKRERDLGYYHLFGVGIHGWEDIDE